MGLRRTRTGAASVQASSSSDSVVSVRNLILVLVRPVTRTRSAFLTTWNLKARLTRTLSLRQLHQSHHHDLWASRCLDCSLLSLSRKDAVRVETPKFAPRNARVHTAAHWANRTSIALPVLPFSELLHLPYTQWYFLEALLPTVLRWPDRAVARRSSIGFGFCSGSCYWSQSPIVVTC